MSHEVSVSASQVDASTNTADLTFLFDGAEVAASLDAEGKLVFTARPASLAADEDATEAVVQAGLNANPPLQFALVSFPEAAPAGEQGSVEQKQDGAVEEQPNPVVENQAPTETVAPVVETVAPVTDQAPIGSAPTEPPSYTPASGDESNVLVLGQSHEEVVLATVGFTPRAYEDDPAPPAPVETVGADVQASPVMNPPHVAESLAPYMPGTTFVPDGDGDDDAEQFAREPTEDDAVSFLAHKLGVPVETIRAAVDAVKPDSQN